MSQINATHHENLMGNHKDTVSEDTCTAELQFLFGEIEVSREVENKRSTFDDSMGVISCFWLVAQIATPPILGMLAQILVQLVNTYFIGNLNDPALLAGVGMGNMLLNVVAFAFMQGLNGALESLVSSAYGAKQFQLCGTYFNRSRLVCSVLMVPIVAIFTNSEAILVLLGQEPRIANVASKYCCLLIPGVWAMGMFDSSRKFLSAQFLNTIPLYVSLFTLMLHVITCWLLVVKLGWAETGAALATNLTYLLNLVICELLMLRNAKIRLTYRLPNKSMFKNIWHYLSIGVPGAMMLCFEWWAFELLALLSGLISVEAQAAEIVVINMASFFFMVPLGTSYAASALTGFFLGEEKIDQAKKYGHLTLVFSTIITIAIVVLLGCFDISTLFTQDPAVVLLIADLMPVVQAFILLDSVHGVWSGIIRGLGRQAYGSIWTLVCYYIFGMPLALYFAFSRDVGIKGLWIGFTIASLVLDIGFWVIIYCGDWNKIVERMKQTMM